MIEALKENRKTIYELAPESFNLRDCRIGDMDLDFLPGMVFKKTLV
jgi:hypothetical protein